MQFDMQYKILKSAENRFSSSLYNIEQILQADLFDSEIDSAIELAKKGFNRAAGVICGIVIEKHLGKVCQNHIILISKARPTISDFNDLLKNNNIIETPTWRNIQRLADLRNLCSHNKEKEPIKDEVNELISGTQKIIKTIF